MQLRSEIKIWTEINQNYLGCFGNLPFLVKLFSRRFWVKSKAGMFVFLWSCGFLARRVFDKMIFYFIKRCPLSFQVPSIQRSSAGACFALKDTLIFSLWELTAARNFQTVWNVNVILTPHWANLPNLLLKLSPLQCDNRGLDTSFLKADF